jgi:hypothetical protein
MDCGCCGPVVLVCWIEPLYDEAHTMLTLFLVHTCLDPDIIFGVIGDRGEMIWKIGDMQKACV